MLVFCGVQHEAARLKISSPRACQPVQNNMTEINDIQAKMGGNNKESEVTFRNELLYKIITQSGSRDGSEVEACSTQEGGSAVPAIVGRAGGGIGSA